MRTRLVQLGTHRSKRYHIFLSNLQYVLLEIRRAPRIPNNTGETLATCFLVVFSVFLDVYARAINELSCMGLGTFPSIGMMYPPVNILT